MALRVKNGVQFSVIRPAGFAILCALTLASRKYGDLEITSGTDGLHSGPNDPHKLGEAYDVHSQSLNASLKQEVLAETMMCLDDGIGLPEAGEGKGIVTAHFYGFIEDLYGPNEHFHFQRRKGVQYP